MLKILEKLKFDFILILLCLLGFFYQVYLITNQYMLGKTVVNIELKQLMSQPLPAITVCIPARLLSISKLVNLNGLNQQLYQEYINLFQEGVANKSFTKTMKVKLCNIYQKISIDCRDKIYNLDKLFELSLTHESIYVEVFGKKISH